MTVLAETVSNREKLQNLVIEAASLFDDGKFAEWLSSNCAASFKYQVTAYSDEIGKKMVWMSEDRTSLTNLMENVRSHEQYPGKLRRHVGLLRLLFERDNKYRTETPVVIWHTSSQGLTQLFAVARYVDEFLVETESPLFTSREVMLDTRRLPMGCLLAL